MVARFWIAYADSVVRDMNYFFPTANVKGIIYTVEKKKCLDSAFRILYTSFLEHIEKGESECGLWRMLTQCPQRYKVLYR